MQQINLYLPELRPKKPFFAVSSIVIACVALFCMLVIYQVLFHFHVQDLRKKVEALENQQVVARQRLDIIRQAARPKPSSHLDEKLEELKTEIIRREKLELIVGKQNFGNTDGFSRSLNTLAAYSSKNIALQRIRLSDGGALLEMRGETSQPDAVANYISMLHQEKPFAKTQFGQLSLLQKERGGHEFSLGFDSVYLDRGRKQNER